MQEIKIKITVLYMLCYLHPQINNILMCDCRQKQLSEVKEGTDYLKSPPICSALKFKMEAQIYTRTDTHI